MRLNKVGKSTVQLLVIVHFIEKNAVCILLSNSVGRHVRKKFVISYGVTSAAFITMLLQGSAVGVWIDLHEGTARWTGYSNWSPVKPESYLTVSSSYFGPVFLLLVEWQKNICGARLVG